MNRSALLILVLGSVVASCGGGATSAQIAERSPSAEAVDSLASPTVTSFIGGEVVRKTPTGVVIRSEGRQIDVVVAPGARIWKETFVSADAIELGDRVSASGVPGSHFLATRIWANIGQLDGVIRSIDERGMTVELSPSGQVIRVDFSAYIQYGSEDGGVKTVRGDLVVGREVGMVIYRPSSGPPRATRIW